MTASTRPIRLDEWEISWEEYKELTYFCLQYPRKKREAEALLLQASVPLQDRLLPGAKGGGVTDPTLSAVIRRERLLRDIRLIERAAAAAGRLPDGADISRALLLAVTTRSGVQAVMANPDIAPFCGKNIFYAARRKFFWVLRELKNRDSDRIANRTEPLKGA